MCAVTFVETQGNTCEEGKVVPKEFPDQCTTPLYFNGKSQNIIQSCQSRSLRRENFSGILGLTRRN
jgi:hypothetical protein